MATPPESSYLIWLQDCMKRYFQAQGYKVLSSTVTQRQEKKIPFDFQMEIQKGDIVKRFGLQIKRPYLDGTGFYWKLQREQHDTIQQFPWIYYALPMFVDVLQQDIACHHVIITEGRFQYKSILRKKDQFRYYRWGGFAESLEKCIVGERIKPKKELTKTTIIINEYRISNSIFVEMNLTKRNAIITSVPYGRY